MILLSPNAGTGIINGRSSNVLNWDDCRFPWAYPLYKNMLANFWTPFEINMSEDIKQWGRLAEEERIAFKKIIGLLAFLDSIQTDYSSKVADYLTDSSLAALMTVLSFQEVVHNQSYSYVLSSLVTRQEQEEVFEYWKHDQVLRERNEFIVEGYQAFVETPEPLTFLRSIVYDVILEGLNFYSGFAFFYNLARHQKMVSTSTMINYINRDEQLHVRLFVQIYRELLQEVPELNTEENRNYVTESFRRAAELEIRWGKPSSVTVLTGFNLMNSGPISALWPTNGLMNWVRSVLFPDTARIPCAGSSPIRMSTGGNRTFLKGNPASTARFLRTTVLMNCNGGTGSFFEKPCKKSFTGGAHRVSMAVKNSEKVCETRSRPTRPPLNHTAFSAWVGI